MLPLLALIPGLLYTGAKVVGPIIEDHAAQITKGVMALTSGTTLGKDIGTVFNTVLGVTDAAKQAELQLEIDSLLAQASIQVSEDKESFYQYGARPFIFWGLGINVVVHYSTITLIDILNLFDFKLQHLAPMDNMALTLISGLLALHIVTRTYEKTK